MNPLEKRSRKIIFHMDDKGKICSITVPFNRISYSAKTGDLFTALVDLSNNEDSEEE